MPTGATHTTARWKAHSVSVVKGHPDKALSRAPVDLTWMLALEDNRKAVRRETFISTDDMPKRSVVEDKKIVDFLRSQGFTIGGYYAETLA
jgi:hypothetical protein